jgi:hypothetical protein
VTEDAMHSEEWTKVSVMGTNSSLDKLTKVIGERRGGGLPTDNPRSPVQIS